MFYECVLIIRPEVSARSIQDIAEEIQKVIESSDGKLLDGEYWGFKTLAYRIKKKAKAHYVCLGIQLSSLDALQRHLKFHRDLLRFLFIKKPQGFDFPTPLFHSALADLGASEEAQTKGEEE